MNVGDLVVIDKLAMLKTLTYCNEEVFVFENRNGYFTSKGHVSVGSVGIIVSNSLTLVDCSFAMRRVMFNPKPTYHNDGLAYFPEEWLRKLT